jgi:hypothetical protein
VKRYPKLQQVLAEKLVVWEGTFDLIGDEANQGGVLFKALAHDVISIESSEVFSRFTENAQLLVTELFLKSDNAHDTCPSS